MILEELFAVAERARTGQKLSIDDQILVRETLPAELASYPQLDLPKKINHPGNFTISGRPVGTFLRSALLIAGQKVYGKKYRGSFFYDSVEKDLAFGIMRSHFHLNYPKGAHCCVQCTLAIYPALEADAIRYFNCGELAENVRKIIDRREWRFSTLPNVKMLNWALRDRKT